MATLICRILLINLSKLTQCWEFCSQRIQFGFALWQREEEELGFLCPQRSTISEETNLQVFDASIFCQQAVDMEEM